MVLIPLQTSAAVAERVGTNEMGSGLVMIGTRNDVKSLVMQARELVNEMY